MTRKSMHDAPIVPGENEFVLEHENEHGRIRRRVDPYDSRPYPREVVAANTDRRVLIQRGDQDVRAGRSALATIRVPSASRDAARALMSYQVVGRRNGPPIHIDLAQQTVDSSPTACLVVIDEVDEAADALPRIEVVGARREAEALAGRLQSADPSVLAAQVATWCRPRGSHQRCIPLAG